MSPDWLSHLHCGWPLTTRIGDCPGGLGSQTHTIEGHLVRVGITGAFLGANSHTDAMGNALRGVIDYGFLETKSLSAAILEVQIGIIGFALESAAQGSFQDALVHP